MQDDRTTSGTAGATVAVNAARGLVGESAAMRAVRQAVRDAADGTGPVLIAGERGTGKAAVATALHAAGPRAGRPLVVVDCATFADAELATGLAGLFASADGGTLLLREVGATGPATQAEILRRPRLADVRLMATTAHDLPWLAGEGAFDAAVHATLSATTIAVPPLRDRAEDVPDLCRHFLAAADRRERRASIDPEPAALRLMAEYPWPRNVRELQNFVERASTVGGAGNPLRPDLIEPWLRVGGSDPVAVTVEALAGKPLADIEKRVILTTLQQFRGHRIKTAGALGIGVRTLGIKLKRWRDEGDEVAAPTREGVGRENAAAQFVQGRAAHVR